VRLIRNEENRFFAGGNNQGIAAATGDHVVLLNADAVVGPGWLSLMIRCAEEDPRIGLVGPCTNFASGIQHICDPGYRGVGGFSAFARRWARDHAGRRREAHRLIAFCLLIKREVVERVGLLDERFGPGGYEDYDYCLRARRPATGSFSPRTLSCTITAARATRAWTTTGCAASTASSWP